MAGSVAKAWLHRAEHLLEGEPEAVAHGYLAIAHRELDFDRGRDFGVDPAATSLTDAPNVDQRSDESLVELDCEALRCAGPEAIDRRKRWSEPARSLHFLRRTQRDDLLAKHLRETTLRMRLHERFVRTRA